MSVSNVDIANNALVKLGASTIISFTENSQAARAVNVIYDQLRNSVLRDHKWNFATKRVTLAQNSEAPAFEYVYSYALPTDCLRVIQMERRDMIFQIEGRNLLTDESPAKIIYIAEISDPNQYDAMFIEAFSARLAAELAVPLTDSRTLANDMMSMYEGKIRDARSLDSQESGEMEVVADTWLNARLSYTGADY